MSSKEEDASTGSTYKWQCSVCRKEIADVAQGFQFPCCPFCQHVPTPEPMPCKVCHGSPCKCDELAVKPNSEAGKPTLDQFPKLYPELPPGGDAKTHPNEMVSPSDPNRVSGADVAVKNTSRATSISTESHIKDSLAQKRKISSEEELSSLEKPPAKRVPDETRVDSPLGLKASVHKDNVAAAHATLKSAMDSPSVDSSSEEESRKPDVKASDSQSLVRKSIRHEPLSDDKREEHTSLSTGSPEVPQSAHLIKKLSEPAELTLKQEHLKESEVTSAKDGEMKTKLVDQDPLKLSSAGKDSFKEKNDSDLSGDAQSSDGKPKKALRSASLSDDDDKYFDANAGDIETKDADVKLVPKHQRDDSLFSGTDSNAKKTRKKKNQGEKGASKESDQGGSKGDDKGKKEGKGEDKGEHKSQATPSTRRPITRSHGSSVDAEVNTTGIHPSPDKTISIVFHVIIPAGIWGWNESCQVKLRFGHLRLGNWKKNIGDFTFLFRSGDMLCFECHLDVDKDVFKEKKGVAYKYCVLNSQHDDEYEYLHGLNSPSFGVRNRWLRVHDGVKEIHQYDSMAYPHVSQDSNVVVDLLKKGWNKLTGGTSSAKNEVSLPPQNLMQSEALGMYLDGHKKILNEMKFTSKFDVEVFINEILDIFYSLRLVRTCVDESRWGRFDAYEANEVSEVLLEFLLDVVAKLFHSEIKNVVFNGRRMLSAVIIACCIHELNPRYIKQLSDIPSDSLSALLSLLRLMPDVQHKKCEDWNFLISIIPKSYKKTVSDSVLALIVHLSHTQYFTFPEWLLAVPFVHFLKSVTVPFQDIEVDPRKIPWSDKLIGLDTIKSHVNNRSDVWVVDKMFDKLRPLFIADPQLLYGFIFACPMNDFHNLIPKVNPFLPISFAAKQLEQMKTLNTAEVKAFTSYVASIQLALQKFKNSSYRMQRATLLSCIYLLEQTFLKIEKRTAPECLLLINHVLTLYLSSVETFESTKADIIVQSVQKVCLLFDKWIKKSFDYFFGESELTGYWLKGYAESEIRMWNSVIPVDNNKKEVVALWHENIVGEIIQKRIKKVHRNRLIELFVTMDSVPKCNSIVVNCIMDAVMDSISNFTSIDVDKLLSSSQKRNVGKIIDNILERRYPGKVKAITLEELFGWDMWQTFIKIQSNQAMIKHLPEFHLSEKCITLCISATSILENVCTQIRSGDITLKYLSLIKEDYSHFQKLLVESMCDVNLLEQVLHQRFFECDKFMERLNDLRQLCQNINVDIEGVAQLRSEITSTNYTCTKLNTLCQTIGDQIEFLSLQYAVPLDSIRGKFRTIVSQQSGLFQEIWRKHMRNAALCVRRKERAKLTIPDIVTAIWDPTFTECKTLLDSLRDRSIKLVDVDHYFQSVQQNMKCELESLCTGIHLCVDSHTQVNLHWIDGAVQHMQDYWSLLTLSKAASVVMELRARLNLTGDFKAIETLSNQVTSSIGNKPLSSIDEKLINAGSFLRRHMSDPAKLRCLEAFANSFKIVEWIRKEAPQGVNDIHKFVDVALHTSAGEGDFANDNLSRLKNVGSGYGPLIYDLPNKPSFSNFEACCVKVWEALKQTRDLPGKLIDCNKDVEWYKSVKDTQASVEVTSYGQMDNIFEYGCYRIGIKKPVICKSHNQVISLTLKCEKRLAKKKYNLEELRDLESKLVLITGRNADNRKMVELFLDTFHSVCRIAELLINLQQIGNVKYTGWVLLVPCSKNEAVIGALQDQAKKMEHELYGWKDVVSAARQEFYELNYYTTVQLLTLRRELSMERLEASDIPPNVLFLLQSISSQVTPATVRDVVNNVVTAKSPFTPSNESPQLAEEVPACQQKNETVLSSLINDYSEDLPQPKTDMPKLTESELTDDERKILEFVVRALDCSKLLVLKAVEKFRGQDKDRYDHRDWCNENLGEFEFEEESGDSEEDPDDDAVSLSSDGSESDNAAQRDFVYASCSQETKVSLMQMSTSIEIVTVESEMQEPVDENHAIVQDLLSAGYSLEQSIDAVERCETLEAAMEYLDQQVLDEDNEGDIIPSRPALIQQTSNDDRPEVDEFRLTWHQGGPPTIHADSTAEGRYLNLEQLGEVLRYLSSRLPGEVLQQRLFSSQFLKDGCPNLVVVEPDLILRSTLSLYMENLYHPLPTPEEVLICSPSTTAEEIELFWMRAVNDPGFRRLFSLIHAEKLSYQVSDQALRSLSVLSQGKQDYRLVIICSNEDEEKSHFISKLHLYRRPFIPRNDIQEYRKYLAIHFTSQATDVDQRAYQYSTGTAASSVDSGQSCVRFVTSDRSGMGKTLYIRRLAENLKFNMQRSDETVHVIVPLHGPIVIPDTLLELFKEHFKNPTCCIYHIDIAPNVLWQVDTILFSLLILRGLCDSQGRVWRCHPNQFYAVEVTLPNRAHVNERDKKFFPESRTVSLMNIMPSVSCPSPRKALDHLAVDHINSSLGEGTEFNFTAVHNYESDSLVLMDDLEFKSDPYQRVYQYIRRHTAGQNLDHFCFSGASEGTMQDCLQLLLHFCGVKDPSWSEIRHFVEFLNLQLKSCEESYFTDPTFVGDVMQGLKGFVVKFMIRMSRDFSTSSLKGEVAVEMEVNEAVDDDDINKYQISQRKRWEQSPHPYIFFNHDRMSITFVGFTVTQQGDLLNPINQQLLERAIMTSQLYTGLKHNRVNFQDDYRHWTKQVMIEKMSTVMGVEYPYDPDETYVLTVDNVVKILAIQMRFRCGIPVVIMGETGCGKTRLIRYMCDLARQGMDKKNMLILKVHGGTTEEDITRFIQQAERESEENRRSSIDTVVFFDEANTTDAIGLIKEIMCDRRINGKPVSDDLKFIAACNPYRKHSEDMIKRLENAGLGFFVQATETQQRLGKIPLRQLVYRVLDLPPSMRPLVYDFGQLNTDTESDYIRQIVSDHITIHPTLKQYQQQFSRPIADVLAFSQKYMRERKDECSFVSLRDVERTMIVFEYLYSMMDVFGPLMNEYATGGNRVVENEDDEEEEFEDYVPPGSVVRALVLALSVCYHARLKRREEYEEGVVRYFTNSIQLSYGAEQFRDEIRWCQEVLLDNMVLGANIARNAALRENVFMMAICVELRIPLFLVGKPGSSKSLAKAIVSESMRGKDSHSDLLKYFKEVQIFSYQCSQLSTPESVIEVFNNASKFQAKQDMKSYVAVVVLDEVGLAEDSPNLPLKALHPLLEDGTEGAKKDFTDQIVSRQERVAFIGISNWALDPAKMNRGVMVTRADPSEDELVFSAMGICSNDDRDPIKKRLEPYFKPFAHAYKIICEKQPREFFGLRDFYSLIKMLYYMCQKSKRLPTKLQLEHAIKRNFGGLETEELNPFMEFAKLIAPPQEQKVDDVPYELRSIMYPDCSHLGLIKTSLSPQEKTWHGENRYVLFLTENYAALDILKNPKSYLEDGLSISQDADEEVDIQPFILFGSSFPKDKEYTQVCRNINQIKICMETGRTVILLNLENLYESLYDVLNQYYIYHADSKYVDLGLQTHRVKCRVDDNFKLILIAEKDTVYDKFPTPLINRMEKHFVLTSSILKDWQKAVLEEFEDWITTFSDAGDSKFKRGDAFIGFQKDTPASVIFQASNLLRSATSALRAGVNITGGKWERVLQRCKLEPGNCDIEEDLDPNIWSNAVLNLSKFLLLQTASPDAIVRLERTELAEEKKELESIYFEQQYHNSIEDFLAYHVHSLHRDAGLLLQVTTHSHLLSQDELDDVSEAVDIRIASFFLHEFDTELNFSNKVGPMFKISGDGGPKKCLVVIQCDSGHLNGDLIACARYRIYDLRAKADDKQTTHVLFIIHLPHHVANSSFVGFQGDPWISSHIDDVRPTSDNAVAANEAIGLSISELFVGRLKSNGASIHTTQSVEMKSASFSEDEPVEFERDQSMPTEDEIERDEGTEGRWAQRVQDEDMEAEEVSGSREESGDMTVEDIESEEGEDERNQLSLNRENNSELELSHNSSLPNAQHSRDNLNVPSISLQMQLVQACHDEQPTRSPLFRRLHGSIQEAASRLKDSSTKRSTKRVEILVHLIPKEPPKIPDSTQFHGILINHIFKVLQERDQTREDDRQWVVNEAMNPRSLQHGGTFRNALSRKVDKVIVPIFSEILASIDQNYNLDLIDPKNSDPAISEFWLSMFRECGVMQFNYTDMVTRPRDQVPGVGGRKAEEDYKCELPFSWLVFDAVESQWDNAKSTAGGGDRLQLLLQLCAAIEPTAVGEVLKGVSDENCEDFYRHYLHDFVRLVHRCKHSQEAKEYELVASALDALVHGDDFCTRDGNITLIRRIASLHIVYEMNRSQVLWFGQLVAHSPEVMVGLNRENIYDKEEMILHLCAVEQALSNLVPPLDKDDPASSLTPWLNEVRVSQNAITSIIDLPSQSAIRVKSRLEWEVIRVLQLFLEHVLLKNPFQQSVAYLVRLKLKLKSTRNFLKVDTLKAVQSHLNLMEKEVKKKKYFKSKELVNLKRDIHNYYIDVVSTLCFGGQSAPEPALIKNLMEVVFTEDRDLVSPLIDSKQSKSDEISVVKSSLLQLLLEHNSESVKEYLQEYFMKSQEALEGKIDENLCLLCIQCFEDALYKQHSGKPPAAKLESAIGILTESHRVLRDYQSDPVTTIGYLEGVAGVRYAVMEIASIFHSGCLQEAVRMSTREQQLQVHLLQHAEELCADPVINTTDFTASDEDVVGPSLYLLKLLVRQYGFPCLKEVFEKYNWVIPEGLRTADQGKVLDPFVVYDELIKYSSLREVLNEALYGRQVEKLVGSTKDFNIKEAAILLLAMYEVVTMSYSNRRRQMDEELLGLFDQFAQHLNAFSPLMRQMARFLLTNQQGGPLAQMTITPDLPSEYKTMCSIVVHSVVVFGSNSTYEILLPFVQMLSDPAALNHSYLPTMAEDNFQEVRRVMGGAFYACPRGHPYFVGECGRPMQELSCITCGARIGGYNHRLLSDNVAARTNDATQTGHVLGGADSRTAPPAPERALSPPAVCIMRALMHSAFLWCSCHYLDRLAAVAGNVIKPYVNPNNLPEFFWMHLRRDVEQLSTVTGKSFDESAIMIHLVLQGILTRQPPTSQTIATVNSLKSKNAREHWEKEFNINYIQPVMGNLDAQISRTMDLIANDENQDHGQLFYLVYERIKVAEGNIQPHLWSYRQRISLEHLGQTLLEKKLKTKYPILHEFLQRERCLRATQYLPDIVKLQRSLYDAFHHRMDRKEAKMITFGEFLKNLRNENTHNEYNEKFESLKRAWALVGSDLKTHARLPLEDQHCLATITKDVTLEYLIPTTTGAGALTVSLVDYLTLTHNAFVEYCSTKVKEKSQSSWDQYKVPITHIHRCHLLDYEHQVVSVVLSHCCYSLRVGAAHTVQYDHQAIEKHILEKFIHGKPRILLDIPQVVYRKDIYTTVTFDAVRKKVSPQENLEMRFQKEILSELRTPDRLRENLDVVDIVIGFLSSGGGKPDKPLGKYVDRVLKMRRRPFSQKAREYCKLQHILSLWKVLSVELARLTWLQEQEPFDSVRDEYLRPLGEESGEDQGAALDKCLRRFDLDQLLGALFEFIETYVKYSPENELLWPLKTVIDQDPFEHLGIEAQFVKELPDSITLDQTVAVWKHIVLYQDNIRQSDN